MSDSTALTRHVAVVELVAAYQASVADVHHAFALLVGAEERLNNAFTLAESTTSMHVRPSRHHGWYGNWSDPEEAVADIRRAAWSHIVDRLELRRALSIAAARTLDAHLHEKLTDEETGEYIKLPELTVENVEGFAQHYAGQLDKLITEAIAEVHEWLRPKGRWIGCRWVDYATNSELEIGPKVILGGVVRRESFSRSTWGVNHHYEDRLTALENVFTALDGKGQINKSHYSLLSNAIKAAGADGRGETELFSFRCFRNHNLHLTFRRLDLLKRLNEVAGGARLKPHETGEAGLVVRRCA